MRETEAGLNPPRFVVSSRLADDHVWAEVLNLGGYDVLCTPFEAREVSSFGAQRLGLVAPTPRSTLKDGVRIGGSPRRI